MTSTKYQPGPLTGLRLAVATTIKSSGVISIRIGSKIVPAQCPQDLSVAVHDPVIVGKVGSQYYVIQRYYTAVGNIEPSEVDEPPSSPCVIDGKTTFRPRSTGSYRAGRWRTDTDDIYQGEHGSQGNQTGCAFYGTQIAAALGGATVLSATLKAKRLSTGGSHKALPTTLVHVGQNTKPSGAPTIGGSYTGPNLTVDTTRTTIVVDTTLAQALVDGTYGGLGIHDASGSPYVRLSGLTHYSAAFALTISWQRSF